jgi:hypothetical protein
MVAPLLAFCHGVASVRPANAAAGFDGLLGIGQGAEQPVGQIHQRTPLAHDSSEARIGQVVSWTGMGIHGVSLPEITVEARRDILNNCIAAKANQAKEVSA